MTTTARGQFSPGPLSRAHQALSGPTHCTSCHVPAGGERRFRCVNCHAEIRQRLAANRGLHPVLMAGKRSDDECIRCHSEHNGLGFVPIRWDVDLSEFDHNKTGYRLDGRHIKLECARCHRPENISAAARRGIAVRNLRRTYLGLSRECGSCHADEHAGKLGTSCERCHVTSAWKDVGRFDHASAKFKLDGAHRTVSCRKCHPPAEGGSGARPRIQYVGLAFEQCSGCHKDPHRAAFTAPCSACHSDAAWKPAHNMANAFDHSKTKFALEGKHAAVACEKCHKGQNFKEPVTHAGCKDCHQDVHGGQLLARGGGECGPCHTVESWKPSKFDVAAHVQTGYPLEGRHRAVACGGCHRPAGTATVYKVRFERCLDCHRDEHQGQFMTAGRAGACEGCHTVERFRPSTYTLAVHRKTRFPLSGAHAAVPCGECHKTGERGHGARYRFDDVSCTGCHQDPHQGRFKVRAVKAGPEGCEGCHTTKNWQEVPKFDHAATRFPLVGAHRAVACDQCHRMQKPAIGVRKAVFGNVSDDCSGCHEDIHAGQFSTAAGKADCGLCHDSYKWKPSRFDHDRAGFRLTGAHMQVRCAQCHKTQKEVIGRMVVFYKPTPRECTNCHGPQT